MAGSEDSLGMTDIISFFYVIFFNVHEFWWGIELLNVIVWFEEDYSSLTFFAFPWNFFFNIREYYSQNKNKKVSYSYFL